MPCQPGHCFYSQVASTLERLHLYNITALPDKYGINHVTDIVYTRQLASYYVQLAHANTEINY